MSKFRNKPIIVEAVQWFKHADDPDVVPFPTERFTGFTPPCEICGTPMADHGWIETLEGGHIVCFGDWIIVGVKGEKYPCKPDIFAATYEPVEEIEPERVEE